jgi:hypothetical protein
MGVELRKNYIYGMFTYYQYYLHDTIYHLFAAGRM